MNIPGIAAHGANALGIAAHDFGKARPRAV
jgi:hypothetical protein